MILVSIFFGASETGVSLKSSADAELIETSAEISDTSVQSPQYIGHDQNQDGAVKSQIYAVYSLQGNKISAVEESKRWPIASLTKLMTALVARDLIPASTKIKIGEIDPETEGYAGGFSAGEIFSRKDLEKSLLMTSSNTAANAIADSYGKERFIDAMRSYVDKVGMINTYFDDPTGLSYKNQSTAEDLDKLINYILINEPEIFKITRTKSDRIYDYGSGRRREVLNINEFAGETGFIGGKTGTTPEAVGNLISIFSSDGGKSGKVIILLGSEDRFYETRNILEKFK